MLPGFVAGEYGLDDLQIDLEALCAASGVGFRRGEATALDAERRRVVLADGSILAYDMLSLDIGSRPALPTGMSEGISVKPISSFAERLAVLDRHVRQSHGPVRLAVVGQGLAGVEIAFALCRRLAPEGSHRRAEIVLVGRSASVMSSRGALARRLVSAELRKAGIAVVGGFDAVGFEGGRLRASDGRFLKVDDVVWATASAAPGWLATSGLALDAAGFVRVDRSLVSLSHPQVFAAGDIASLCDSRPKAGVFAVRQGPVLHDNLDRAATGRPLRSFRPQKHWLALIGVGSGRAVADKWGIAACGRWVARWKRRTDTSFVERYRTMPRSPSPGATHP